MDAKQKIILACAAVLLCAGVAWYLFSVPSTGSTDDRRVEKRLDDTAREQQKAADSIRDVSEGIDASADSAGDIADGIERSTEHAENIERKHDSAAESAERIAAGNDSVAKRIEAAERSDREAAVAVDRAAATLEQCREFNRSSSEIFGRYASGVAEERESARTDGNTSKK